jgi:hypothetical protein
MWRVRLYQFFASLGILVFAVATGESKHSSLHGMFIGLLVVFVIGELGGTVLWFRYRGRSYEAASIFLRTAISARNWPPSNPIGFEDWCKRNRVAPPNRSRET